MNKINSIVAKNYYESLLAMDFFLVRRIKRMLRSTMKRLFVAEKMLASGDNHAEIRKVLQDQANKYYLCAILPAANLTDYKRHNCRIRFAPKFYHHSIWLKTENKLFNVKKMCITDALYLIAKKFYDLSIAVEFEKELFNIFTKSEFKDFDFSSTENEIIERNQHDWLLETLYFLFTPAFSPKKSFCDFEDYYRDIKDTKH